MRAVWLCGFTGAKKIAPLPFFSVRFFLSGTSDFPHFSSQDVTIWCYNLRLFGGDIGISGHEAIGKKYKLALIKIEKNLPIKSGHSRKV